MKVILRENVPNLGEMGAIVNVTGGYARNYLLPRNLAVAAESASAKQIEHHLRIIRKREEKVRAELAEVAKRMEAVTIEIKARAGEEDKLFGSVTAAQIVEELAKLGFEVDRKKVHLEEPIKTLGVFAVPVRLATGIEAQVKVWVTSETPPAEPAEDAGKDAEPAKEEE